jgi:hypothetical protein
MDSYGFLWIPMDFYGFQWISIDFYGFLWSDGTCQLVLGSVPINSTVPAILYSLGDPVIYTNLKQLSLTKILTGEQMRTYHMYIYMYMYIYVSREAVVLVLGKLLFYGSV